VIVVLCALFLVACLIAAGVVAAWLKRRRAVLDVTADKPTGSRTPGDATGPGRGPQTLEGVLTRQLVTGEITGRQYRHAMARIAIRDAERHPLKAPPDVNPPEAA
jgi:hypothetical protein